ncbi:hypothetical protein AUC31_01050 [Planococcus rifietoensis]|uniref:Uncharacterized protein n=1 Tax=Planococcus rifietoensis TaxID=200991 RepID=A0A0U2ZDA9_9BACL|nr:hypothetical protein [Planococcus rifietoensis]ALS73921.1 hypothetical protein AUC31_01050 [Planococcus rifietoensis]
MSGTKRTGKVKETDDYNKPGRDFKEVLTNYKKYTTSFEFKTFLGIPIIASIIVFSTFLLIDISNAELLRIVIDMNSDALTVIAILAGFNTTSLAIIAASNSSVLKFLRQHTVENGDGTLLKQLVSFFSFAILIQLIVLIGGLILEVISNSFSGIASSFSFLSGLAVTIPLSLLGALWLGAILFTIIISLRNATLLYRYVLFVADYDE